MLVFVIAAAIAGAPAQASNYQIRTTKAVNASKTLQLGVRLYPSLTSWCTDAAIFAKVTNPTLTQAQRQAADNAHGAFIAPLPSIEHGTKVFVVNIDRVHCSGDPDDSNPMALVRVTDGKYRSANGWVSAEAIP